jgi:hypothetical protein
MKRIVWLAVCCAVAVAGRTVSSQSFRYDVLIAGGTVIDGTGQPGRAADVGIKDGRIAAVGRLPRAQAARVVDAAHLVVAPGFIDVHTHADNLVERPAAANFVRMGVTTIVAGNCGSSALDVGAALQALRDAPAAINFATLIGHNTVRVSVMGTDDRPPKAGELGRMKSLVWKAMADGAIGFSTGLQYVPGTYAQMPEIVELARVSANAGGIYASHMRNEGTALEEALAETRDLAPESRQPEPLGLQRAGAGADRRCPRQGRRRSRRSICLHRGELIARRSFSFVGIGRRAGAHRRAAQHAGDVAEDQDGDGRDARRARPARPVVRGRGDVPAGPYAERAVAAAGGAA